MREQELSILAFLLQHPQIYESYKERIREVHFHYDPAKILFKILEANYAKYGKFPNAVEFAFIIDQKYAEVSPFVRARLAEDTSIIFDSAPTGATQELLARHIIEREAESIGEVLSQSAETLLDRIPHLTERLDKLHALGSPLLAERSWFCPFRREFIDNPPQFQVLMNGMCWIRTGVPRLDSALQGGLKPGELSIIVGTTGAGKSLFMIHVAMQAIRDGRRVVYYALDNTKEEMAERFYANVTKIPLASPKERDDYTTRLRGAVKAEWDSRLYLVEWPAGSRTVRDIERDLGNIQRHAAALDRKRGVAPDLQGHIDLVVIDYGDCLLPEVKYNELRHGYGFVFQRLMGLGTKTKASILTGTQGNRGALSKDTPTLEDIAEAFNKSWPAGLVMTFCQSYAERENRLCRIAVVKARRERVNYMVPCAVDYGTMSIADNPKIDVMSLRSRDRFLRKSSQEGS